MSNNLKRKTIFHIWVENDGSKKFDAVLTYVQQIGNLDSHEQYNKIKKTLRTLCQSFERRWAKVGRHRECFVNANAIWLEKSQIFSNTASETSSLSPSVESVKKGRPLKEFANCSSYTQRKKTNDLVTSKSQEELTTALARKLHQSGKRDSAVLVKKLSFASSDLGTKVKKARENYQKMPQSLSSDQALALLIDTNLSRHRYNAMRFHVSHINSKLYPPYHLVHEAKKSATHLKSSSLKFPLK